MADPYREPIEDSDLQLQEKIVGGGESRPVSRTKAMPEKSRERFDAEKDSTYAKLLQRMKGGAGTTSSAHTVARDARDAAAHPDVEQQVRHLLDLAMTKGVIHAVRTARHMSDYYIMDAVHDRLVSEELYKKLKSNNLI